MRLADFAGLLVCLLAGCRDRGRELRRGEAEEGAARGVVGWAAVGEAIS